MWCFGSEESVIVNWRVFGFGDDEITNKLTGYSFYS